MSLPMGPREFPISPAHHRGFMPESLALAVSAAVLYHFGEYSPLDHDTLMIIITCYLQLFITTLTLFLGLTLLHLCLITHPSPSPAYQLQIHRLSTATLAATFSTLITLAATTNSALLSPQTVVSWASELGLIVIAVAFAFKLINATVTLMSCFQQYIKVSIFCLCVAIAGVCIEPLGSSSMASTISFSSVVYRFGLVPCTFALAVLLLVIGVAVPGNMAIRFVSVGFKEVFAKLTLSVGCVTLVIGTFLMVCTASVLSSAMPH